MNYMKNQKLKIAGAMAFLASPASLSAALISWGTASVIDDAGAFVNTTGNLVTAINSDTLGDDALISSVNFVGHNLDSWNAGTIGAGGITVSSNAVEGNFGTTFVQGMGAPPGITNNGPVDNLISSGIWREQTLTLENLTINNTYIIQIISNDSRNGRDLNNVTVLTDGVDPSAAAGINPLSSTEPGAGNPALVGHSIVGTFVADSTTQTFNVFGSTDGGTTNNNNGRAQINGFQLRTIPVPEPSSTLLIGVASLGLLLRRCR